MRTSRTTWTRIRRQVTVTLGLALGTTTSQTSAAVSYKTSAEANAAMAKHKADLDAASQCRSDARSSYEAQLSDKNHLEQENEELKARFGALVAERDQALLELSQGLFCSRCNRSKSEIERDGTNFYQHLDDVNGTPIPAAPEVIERRRQEYESKLQALREQFQRNLDRVVTLVAQLQKDRLREMHCQSKAMLAYEGFLRAKHWRNRLQALEAENRLKESLLPKPLEANRFGLGKNLRNSEYFVQRAYLKDGSVVTINPDTQLDSDQVLRISTHRGIDFSSRDGDKIKPLPFTAGTNGQAWVTKDSQYNTINVRDKNTGNVVQFLHASNVSSQVGNCTEAKPCNVWSGTRLGTTGSTGADAVHLHVQVRDQNGNFIDPDMAFLPKSSPFFSIEADVQKDLQQVR